MSMIDRLNSQLGIQRAALDAMNYRQVLLASNIANADTPHFKARDIDFKAALESAVAQRQSGSVGISATSSKHIVSGAASSFADALRYRSEFQASVDGNTVNMDIERSAFAENSLRIEAAITFINGQFKTMQLALSQ